MVPAKLEKPNSPNGRAPSLLLLASGCSRGPSSPARRAPRNSSSELLPCIAVGRRCYYLAPSSRSELHCRPAQQAARCALQQHRSSPCVVVELRHSPPHDQQPSPTLPSPKTASHQQPGIPSVSLACHPLDVLRNHIVAARCPSTRSPFVFPVGATALTSPRAASSLICGANGQHAVMPAGCLLFLAQPQTSTSFTPGEAPRVLREGKPLNARRHAELCKNQIANVLTNTDWVCLW
ncbi:hypothetical protein ZEAMMB73_Zm00001d031032 [Zea mays]|uniref:Uncharacterized protein n=1 Tax=Zea mays TaxID=4577 RepID=A0A1D6KG04_MAIZE|nr:hypothetical protein ZEAMMB73_Zm00001d031032 [Zea mays]